MDERKRAILVGAKTNWSHATRAAMVRLVVDRLTREARREYHFVAAGPKITMMRGGELVWADLRDLCEREGGYLRRRRPFGLCERDCAFRGRRARRLVGRGCRRRRRGSVGFC